MRRYLEFDSKIDFPLFISEHTPNINADILHWHDDLEIGICLEGKGKFLFVDREYDVCPGDIFIVNNFEHHIAVSDPEYQAKFLFIFFLPELIANPGSSTLDFEYLSPFWYNSKSFCNKVDHSEKISTEIGNCLSQIFLDSQTKEMGYKHLAIANVKRILALLIRHYKTMEADHFSSHTSNQKRLQKVLEYIRRNYRSNITLAEVSELIHMSASRFRHYFKDVTNFNFKEYIFYLRIAEAKRLLADTEMSISDIADDIGFSNLNQFYMLFNKYVLSSPAKYRYNCSRTDF